MRLDSDDCGFILGKQVNVLGDYFSAQFEKIVVKWGSSPQVEVKRNQWLKPTPRLL